MVSALFRCVVTALIVVCASLPLAAQSLVNGGVVSSAISVAGEQDSYTFSGNTAERVQLRVADTSANTFHPRVALYGPGGTYLAAGTGPDVGGIVDFSLPTAGTYTVVVTDNSSGQTETGNYNLYFVRAPGANEAGALDNGGVRSGAIDLGDLDSYTFAGNVGERVQLRVVDTSNNSFYPRVSVYGPSGAYLTAGTGPAVGGIVDFALPSTGTYTVVVADNGGGFDGVGNYNLYFVRAPGANEGGRLYDGVTRVDTIDLGDLDSFTFTAEPGNVLQVQVTDTTGAVLYPRVSLYGPTGAYLTAGTGPTSASISNQTLMAGGIYTLVVADNGGGFDGTGSYSISISGAGGTDPGAVAEGDIPVPPWALAALAAMLGSGMGLSHRKRR